MIEGYTSNSGTQSVFHVFSSGDMSFFNVCHPEVFNTYINVQ